jgi:hypothetical protein
MSIRIKHASPSVQLRARGICSSVLSCSLRASRVASGNAAAAPRLFVFRGTACDDLFLLMAVWTSSAMRHSGHDECSRSTLLAVVRSTADTCV